MMHQDHATRGAGYVLIAGGLAWVLANVLHAPQPTTLEQYVALPAATWLLAHWLIVVAAPCTATGIVALGRVLERSGHPTSSLAGRVGALLSCALFVGIGSIEAGVYPLLGGMYAGGGEAAAGAAAAYIAVNATMLGLVLGAIPVFSASMLVIAYSMTGDARWPKWLTLSGMVVAAVNIPLVFLPLPHTASMAAGAAMGVWLAAAGYFLTTLVVSGAGAPAKAPAGF
jgi:hypothetical protein